MAVNDSKPRSSGEQRKTVLYWLCPLFTIAVCIIFAALKNYGSAISPQLSIFILCVIICGTFTDLRMTMITATIALLALIYNYAQPGYWFRYDAIGFQRLIFGFFLLYGSALAVGKLKNRLITAEVRLLEERYRDYASLFKEIDVPIVECDWQRILSVNGAFCRLTGFTEKELLDLKPPYPFWPIDDHARTARALESAMRGLAREFELTLVRKDGNRFPVLMYVSQIKNDKGEVARQVYSYHDLSLFKRTERELKEAEKLLSDAILAADMAVVITDGGVGVAHVRGNFEQLHGLAPGSFSGRLVDLQGHIPEDDWQCVVQTLQQAKRDRVNFEYQYRVNLPDGTQRWLRGAGCYQYDSAGTPLRALVVLQDITAIHRWVEQIKTRV